MQMMFRPRWNKVIRDLWNNKTRTLLVVLAIAVGIFMVGVTGISQSILKSELNAVYMETNPAHIQMFVSPFSDDLVRAVVDMREVERVEARVTFKANMQLSNGSWMPLTIDAIDDFNAVQISTFDLESGLWPQDRRHLMLERTIMNLDGMDTSQPVLLELPDGRTETMMVSGLVHDVVQAPARISSGGVGYISLDTYQWLTGSRQYNHLYLLVNDHTDDRAALESTADLIQDRLERDGYAVSGTSVPEPGKHWNADAYDGLVLILVSIGIFSLFFTLFLVTNTITAIIKQQTRQIGMMKAVGGRTSHIMGLYLTTVVIFGLLATGIAIPASRLIGRIYVDFGADLNNFEIRRFSVAGWITATQVGLGICLPLVAAFLPVVAGARITIREALSDYGINRTRSNRLFDNLLHHWTILPRPFLLSLRNTFRRTGRLVLTLLTLLLAGAVFISIFNMRQSLTNEIETLFRMFSYDVAVTMSEPVSVQRAERIVLGVEGITDTEGWLIHDAHYHHQDGTEGTGFILHGIPDETRFVEPHLIAGRWLRADADEWEIVAQENLTIFEPEVHIGDLITVELGEHQEAQFRLVGLLPSSLDGGEGGGLAYTRISGMEQLLNLPGQTNYVVVHTARQDNDFQFEVKRHLETQFQQTGIGVATIVTGGKLSEEAASGINIMIGMMLSIAALLAFVGALGLAGTMGLNVLERTREIGVLRSVGASNGMVFFIVVGEGILIGLFSVLLGLVGAIPITLVLNWMVGTVIVYRPLYFVYTLDGAVIWLVLALVIGAISSFLPARRAARLSVRETLAYE